jgi:hypothetical protein
MCRSLSAFYQKIGISVVQACPVFVTAFATVILCVLIQDGLFLLPNWRICPYSMNVTKPFITTVNIFSRISFVLCLFLAQTKAHFKALLYTVT